MIDDTGFNALKMIDDILKRAQGDNERLYHFATNAGKRFAGLFGEDEPDVAHTLKLILDNIAKDLTQIDDDLEKLKAFTDISRRALEVEQARRVYAEAVALLAGERIDALVRDEAVPLPDHHIRALNEAADEADAIKTLIAELAKADEQGGGYVH